MSRTRPQWASLAGACLLAVLVACVAGFMGLIGGGGFATAQPSPPAAFCGWGVAGLALGAPVVALPRLGFGVRRPVAWLVGVAVAVVVLVGGYAYTMTP